LNSDLHFEIAIIGAGGIGSNLIANLVPALHRGGILDSTEGITIRVYDSDEVCDSNLAHQRFSPGQVGMTKVEAVRANILPFIGEKLSMVPCPWDVRVEDDLVPYDIAIVAVDSPTARRVIHSLGGFWLDLRCRGDGFVALDFRVLREHLSKMTPDQPGMSCQLEGAISSGNIQFGHTMAAAHGSQWAVQMMRLISSNNGSLPEPQIASISFGTLSKQPLEEVGHSIPRGNVKPFQHSERSVRYSISTGDVNSTEVVETIALLAKEQDWPALWEIADSMKREVSVLFDSKGRIFVDVGTQGEVAMSPPIGAEIPFRLWVHTHPWDSYWSETDRNTISCYTEILEEAIVLGHDHYKRTRPTGPNDTIPRLSRTGPLSSWTEEELVPYLSAMDVME
tara:strand:- start:2217 stop:3398 length:1182 start_codon:yes stop_codon:yes gene_type:complete